MNVALYYPWVYLPCGAERTILELTGRSRHQWTIYTNHFDAGQTFPAFQQRQVKELRPVSVRRSLAKAAQSAYRIATTKLPQAEHDALLVVCEGLGDLALVRNSSIPAVCLCLTPLRAAFDSSYGRRTFAGRGRAHRLALGLSLRAFSAVDRLLWKRYQRVICISEEVRRRVLEGKLAGPDKLEVAHVGIGFDPPRPSEQFDRFFFLPGRMMWTKNIELGIQAFRRFLTLHDGYRDFRLVIAGIVDRKSAGYFEELKRLAGGDSRIEFRVHPSDAELEALYRSCYGVLFTAFNEDWGITPIEGMAFGKPVVAVDCGGPRESIVDGVHGFREPIDVERFAARLAALASDPELARRMGRAAFDRARTFSWTSFTQRVDDVIDGAVSASGVGRHRAYGRQIASMSPQ